ncbi:MAG TPA: GNAT family N-acetyltransferase [Deltaproteobacteria bacterium]|nr:GNAT family N-acetyltransferase [Deltaproteobacteria bacterium]
MLKDYLRKCRPFKYLLPDKEVRQPPPLKTDRLILRPFTPSDAKDIQRLAGDEAIADTTLNIPHPYDIERAKEWIDALQPQFENGKRTVFAMIDCETDNFIGAIELRIDQRYQRGELGYWIGKPFWNSGFCTEAGQAVLAYGFARLNLNRIYANHFSRNQASGRVMQKLGMLQEGHARQHIKKGDQFEDIEIYGILKKEWEAASVPLPLNSSDSYSCTLSANRATP